MPKVRKEPDWDEFARTATGSWEIAPSEYRNMTPHEFWLIYDGKKRAMDSVSERMTPPTMEEIEAFELKLTERQEQRGH